MKLPQLDLDEALRYAGVPAPAPEALRADMAHWARELAQTIPPRYVYRVLALEHRPDGIYLPAIDLPLPGQTAQKMLADCDEAVLLACTLGARFDALLRREQARDMSQALLLDGCGGAWVEAGCNAAEEELRTRFPHRYLTDRFSPGYGDLPLSIQPALCDALNAYRRLGLSLSETFLLNPVKSVTAIVGLSHRPQPTRIRGCRYCSLQKTCTFRKGGTSCGI
mgnify:CR=1 FL=1